MKLLFKTERLRTQKTNEGCVASARPSLFFPMTAAQYEGLRNEILNITLDSLSAIDSDYVRDKSYVYTLNDVHKELELGLRVLERQIVEYKRHAEP